MKVPLLDLKKQYISIRDEVLKATKQIYDKQQFVLGPEVERLEKEIADYCSVKHSVGVSSGTDALIIALMAAGIGQGDSVITSAYTFFATAGSIARMGAKPIFADIDSDTYNVSPEGIENIIEKMTDAELENLKAVIPVHLFGQCCEMDSILKIANKYNLIVIEDAAQAIGAEYKGKRSGSMGDFGCFSFFPSKNLGAFGDGGIVTTNSDKMYDKLCALRIHGAIGDRYDHQIIGGNFRLDALQAAIVLIKLRYLDTWSNARLSNANKYRKLFINAGMEDIIKLPVERENRHVYNQFVIRVKEKRDKLHLFLKDYSIGTQIYYPSPLHLLNCFSYLNYNKGDMSAAESASLNTLALPIYPELTYDQLEYVVDKITEFLNK